MALNPARFQEIASLYSGLRVLVMGDFCLDRYMEIDPAREESSIETGRPVHNVVRVRSQPGGAGTIVNNLAALGVGVIRVVGFAGEDGEGFELCRGLEVLRGVDMTRFLLTPERRTFAYAKPLIVSPGKAPVELNRLDLKNWTPTPSEVESHLMAALAETGGEADAIILLDQVDIPGTGVITHRVLATLEARLHGWQDRLILADSRTNLKRFPRLSYKLNRSEFACFTGASGHAGLPEIGSELARLARHNERPCFVTLAENGIIGASPDGQTHHVSALPLRGEIDIVGAGDSITANLAAALAAKASLREAVEIANTAASIVIHKLGETGSASVQEIAGLLSDSGAS